MFGAGLREIGIAPPTKMDAQQFTEEGHYGAKALLEQIETKVDEAKARRGWRDLP